jgi:hypothetical protein
VSEQRRGGEAEGRPTHTPLAHPHQLTSPPATPSTAAAPAGRPPPASPTAAYVPRKARLLAWEDGMPGSALRPAAVGGRAWLMRRLRSFWSVQKKKVGVKVRQEAGEAAHALTRPAHAPCPASPSPSHLAQEGGGDGADDRPRDGRVAPVRRQGGRRAGDHPLGGRVDGVEERGGWWIRGHAAARAGAGGGGAGHGGRGAGVERAVVGRGRSVGRRRRQLRRPIGSPKALGVRCQSGQETAASLLEGGAACVHGWRREQQG